jgi:hypothetical protein
VDTLVERGEAQTDEMSRLIRSQVSVFLLILHKRILANADDDISERYSPRGVLAALLATAAAAWSAS